jgi:flagellar assembly protein FliH
MRSSSRIIHATGAPAPVDRHAPAILGRNPSGGSVATASVVLRGRRRAGEGRTDEVALAAAQPTPGSGASASEMAAVSASALLGVDLQQALRIAEERGYAIGHARGVEEFRAAVAAAAALSLKLEAMAPSRTNAIAHAIAEVAMAVARRVVGAHLVVDPTILIGALETAVGRINGSPDARVLLHPDVVEIVRETWEQTHGRSYLGKSWTFEGDPAMPPGGCMLRFEHGFVDAGLETQLEEIGIALDTAVPAIWAGAGRIAGASIGEVDGSNDPDNLTDPIR